MGSLPVRRAMPLCLVGSVICSRSAMRLRSGALAGRDGADCEDRVSGLANMWVRAGGMVGLFIDPSVFVQHESLPALPPVCAHPVDP